VTLMSTPIDEQERAARLLQAQGWAEELFVAIAEQAIRPGRTELEVSRDCKSLASEMFGVTQHWHKRVIRSGPNTLQPYRENPPDRVIGEDDIVFVDLGPVFEKWEADVGRTYVLGDDPAKLRLRDDLEPVWQAGKAFFDARPDITGQQLYARMQELAMERGWEFGGDIAGHLVGEFPHEKIASDEWESYIAPRNERPMRGLDPTGRHLHWILEVHLVDRDRQIGGFHEQLLTLP